MPIIELGREDKEVVRVVRPDEMAILVIRTEHVDAEELKAVLQQLLGESAITGVFVSPVTGGDSLLVRAGPKALKQARELLAPCVDPTDRRVVEVFEVGNDARMDAVRARLAAVLAADSGHRTPTPGEKTEKTVFHPDPQTGRLTVITASPNDLERINAVLEKLLGRPLRRLRTGRVALNHEKPQEVARELKRRMRGSAENGRPPEAPPYRIIPHTPSKSLLIQAPPRQFDRILEHLKGIDHRS
jgi:type II secretory pathway component GspD/PulD (secretin)